MKQCKTGKHDYRHFNNKSKIFLQVNEYRTSTGVCIKCGRLKPGIKEIKK